MGLTFLATSHSFLDLVQVIRREMLIAERIENARAFSIRARRAQAQVGETRADMAREWTATAAVS